MPVLHVCWWCGEGGAIRRRLHSFGNFDSGFGKNTYYQCSNCKTRSLTVISEMPQGRAFSPKESLTIAAFLWNKGEVIIPSLHITMPTNHVILRREMIERKTRTLYAVSNQRGIAESLRDEIKIVFTMDGTILPHRFRLFSHAHEWTNEVKLVSYNNVPGSGYTTFEFETSAPLEPRFSTNKSDSAWLNREKKIPPIYDKIFAILASDYK